MSDTLPASHEHATIHLSRWRSWGGRALYALIFLYVIQWGLSHYVASINDDLIGELTTIAKAKTLRELAESQGDGSGEGDAFPFFVAAAEHLPNNVEANHKDGRYIYQGLDQAQIQACEQALDESHGLIELGRGKPRCVSTLHWEDSTSPRGPHTIRIERLSYALIHSFQFNIKEGDVGKAEKRLVDATVLARRAYNEPLMTSHINKVSALTKILDCISTHDAALSTGTKGLLAAELSKINLEKDLHHALMGECYFGLLMWDQIQSGHFNMSLFFNNSWGRVLGAMPRIAPLWFEMNKMEFLKFMLPALRNENEPGADLKGMGGPFSFLTALWGSKLMQLEKYTLPTQARLDKVRAKLR